MEPIKSDRTAQRPRRLKRVLIKEELVELTGDHIKAVVLGQLIYWTERVDDFDKYITEERSRMEHEGRTIDVQPLNGWIFKSAEELIEETMIDISPPTMGRHLQKLIDSGYLQCRNNPEHKWDRTKQYRVDMIKLCSDLGHLGYALDGYAFFKMKDATFKMKDGDSNLKDGDFNLKDRTVEFERAIPEITTEIKKDDDTMRNNTRFDSTPNQNVPGGLVDNRDLAPLDDSLVLSDRVLKGQGKNTNSIASSVHFGEVDPYAAVEHRMSKHLSRPYNGQANEYRVLKQLLESGVPIDFVLTGIDYTFSTYTDRGIRSFAYCAEVIKRLWASEMAKQDVVEPIDWLHQSPKAETGERDRKSCQQLRQRTTKKAPAKDERYENFYKLFPND